MIKRALKSLLMKPARLLVASAASGQAGPLDSWAGPYTLNPLFVSLMETPDCRGSYTWPAMQAARLTNELGLAHVSFIEFGVAGGNGLVTLEKVAERLERHFGIRINVYGFDTGTGLPKPCDYRDMPNLWSQGYFPMDVEKLRRRLTKAELVLGPVKDTIPRFLESSPPPVAFVSFDLDFYSSTVDALGLFCASQHLLLPRVHCYFDDILGYTFCDYNGERLAITDFNTANPLRKLAAIPGIRYYVPRRFADAMWEKYYMLHIFDHELYGHNDGSINPTSSGLVLRE